jgi:hypothetical protein
MKFAHIILCYAPHAYLHQRYDCSTKRHIDIGRPGKYGREDINGIPYKCLGDERNGKVYCSTDLKPGPFYPSNVFIFGASRHCGDSLTHKQLETFKGKFWDARTERFWLPKGYDKGRATWEAALMYSPIESKPDWDNAPKRLENLFPDAYIIARKYFISIDLDNADWIYE